MKYTCVICDNETEFRTFIDISFVCRECWQRSWVWALKKAYEEETNKLQKIYPEAIK